MTKIMNNNKVCIISFLICHIYSVNVNDERRKVMNLELIKNNIIFRLITKKEFDRLTKQYYDHDRNEHTIHYAAT